jgi:hypothetical protein
MTHRFLTYARLGVSLALVGLLAACSSSDLKRSLGLERQGPDAFQVVARAPLEMPPDFALRPPVAGAARPNEVAPSERARQLLLGRGGQAASTGGFEDRSPAEAALLRESRAGTADPRIRETVNRENVQLVDADRSLVDRLVFWREATPAGSAVDAGREAQRIRDNVATGRPVTAGDTPVIQRRQRGILEGLLPRF